MYPAKHHHPHNRYTSQVAVRVVAYPLEAEPRDNVVQVTVAALVVAAITLLSVGAV